MYALLRTALRRARDERGFGMVELLCAMGVMAIGILAVFSMFQTGVVTIKRASTISTAAALADSEMESYRAVKYDTIGLSATALASTDPTYTSDSARRAVSSPENQTNSAVVVAACPATPCTSATPTRSVTGADGKSYRVDTYVTWEGVQNTSGVSGRDVKRVTIVVRDGATNRTYARVASSFDESTGQ